MSSATDTDSAMGHWLAVTREYRLNVAERPATHPRPVATYERPEPRHEPHKPRTAPADSGIAYARRIDAGRARLRAERAERAASTERAELEEYEQERAYQALIAELAVRHGLKVAG